MELAAAERPAPGNELVVSITLNGEGRGDFFVLQDPAGGLLIKRGDAETLGLNLPAEAVVTRQGQEYFPLSDSRALSVVFDEKKLTLTITGKANATGKTVIDFARGGSGRGDAYVPRETSAFFNYGLTSSSEDSGGSSSFTATGKLGLRSGDAFFVTDGEYDRRDGDERFTRLMSSLTYERRADLQWLVVGDHFARPGPLTGATLNIGGIGFVKSYALDPYFSTRPRFDFSGAVAYPSRAEVYLDGRRIGEYRLAAGEFELKDFSSYGGAHLLEVLLKDPFGNETWLRYPQYYSDVLLNRGLQEYGYHVGFLRDGYGVESNDYGKPAFSAYHRYGLSSSLNVGAHAEGGGGTYEGGVQFASLIPRLGQLTLNLAGSSADSGSGWSGMARHTYQNGRFAVSLLLRGSSEDFTTVGGGQPGTGDVKYEAAAGLGYSFQKWGGMNVGWSALQRYGNDETRTAWASYTNDLSPRSTLFLTARLVEEQERDLQLSVGYLLRLSRNTQFSANAARTKDTDRENVQLQKSLQRSEGLGYRVSLDRRHGDDTTGYLFEPSLEYNAPFLALRAAPHFENDGKQTKSGLDLTAAGSLVYAGGLFGLSRPVDESFTFVMADSLAGAAVQLDGETVGRTGANGRLVIPSLAPYYVSEIGLDPGDFPMEMSASVMKAKLSPSRWSGACVSFDVVPMRAVFGTMMLQDGHRKVPIEFGELTLLVGDQEVKAPLAKGGEFYLENRLPLDTLAGAPDPKSCRGIIARLAAGNPVIKPGRYRGRIGEDGAACEFELTFPDTEDVMTDLGEIVCSLPETLGPANAPHPPVAATPTPRAAAPGPAAAASSNPMPAQAPGPAAPAPSAVAGVSPAAAAAEPPAGRPAAAPGPPAPAPEPAAVRAEVAAAPTESAPAPAAGGRAEQTLPESLGTLLGLWKLDDLAEEVRLWTIFNFRETLLPVYFEETALSRTYGMEFATRPATLDSLRAMDLPCVALEADGPQGPRFVVFAGFDGDQAVVLEPGGGRSEMPAAAWVAQVKGSLMFLVAKAEAPETAPAGTGAPEGNP